MLKRKYNYEPLWLKPETKKRFDDIMIEWTKYLNIKSNDMLMRMILETAEKQDSNEIIQIGRRLAYDELGVKE